jgi:hypothetical protein
MYTPQLELDDIQGDMLVGMQKNAELFLFFKITDAPRLKTLMRQSELRDELLLDFGRTRLFHRAIRSRGVRCR